MRDKSLECTTNILILAEMVQKAILESQETCDDYSSCCEKAVGKVMRDSKGRLNIFLVRDMVRHEKSILYKSYTVPC